MMQMRYGEAPKRKPSRYTVRPGTLGLTLEEVLFDSIQLDRTVAIRKQTKSFFVAKTA